MIMLGLVISFFASFLMAYAILRSKHLHGRFSEDLDFSGPQKVHSVAVPRIGGLCIMFGVLVAVLIKLTKNNQSLYEMLFFFCAIPVFAIGLAEDITKKIGVNTRLFVTAISAFFATQILGFTITSLDIPLVDSALMLEVIATIFTIFAITGLTNAYNIIDGFNGLASMVGIITLLALSYICFKSHDPMLMYLCLIVVAAIMGFFVWNYPAGRIFLGDGGAYLIGFLIALISILLVTRHPNVSPWFAFLVNAYPIVETLFTIYRRKIHKNKNPGHPDGMHFHTLIYRRVLNSSHSSKLLSHINSNSRTSPFLWMLSSGAIVPAIFWWDSTPVLITFSFIFAISYWWLYRQIVYFKVRGWPSKNKD